MAANPIAYVPRFDFTEEPFELAAAYDGSVNIELYRARLDRYNRIELGRRDPMLTKRRADGELLYCLTSSGHVVRRFPLTKSRRRQVHARDLVCVWCASDQRLEIDHIVRYGDGGSNELDNLRLLCHDCHATRGGE